jgi:hypothetical protein
MIKPNDLVMVVRPQPCCGDASGLGFVYAVDFIHSGDVTCTACRRHSLSDSAFPSRGYGYLTSVLKRLDPPALEKSEEREAELVIVR